MSLSSPEPVCRALSLSCRALSLSCRALSLSKGAMWGFDRPGPSSAPHQATKACLI
jgi:hypothetical protein